MNGKERFLAAVRGDVAELCAGVAYPEIPLRDHSEEDFGQPWWRLDEADAAVFNPMVRQYLRIALMGNLAAEETLAGGDDRALAQEAWGQVVFGRRRGRFLFGTGSPPTPGTPLDRLALALATARRQWNDANRSAE